MRGLWVIGAATAALAGGAQAAELEIKHAAARVVVIPEARSDVQVTITPGAARLPQLEVRRNGASVEIDGDLRNRIRECGLRGVGVIRDTGNPLRPDSQLSVEIRDHGRIRVADLPLITARVPLDADVSAGGAVWGSVGRARSLELGAAGCGDWTVANVSGPLKISVAGSGDVSAGTSTRADVSVAGSGDVRLGPVSGPLNASVAGSGDVHVASVAGDIDASIAGSGDIVVAGGRGGALDASIAGSGDIRVDGPVQSLDASVLGSGDIAVASVSGNVSQSVMGSGDIVVAGRALPRRGRRD
jgi:hypothetical protein